MSHSFSQQFAVTSLHVDRYGRLKLSTLLHFAQSVAEAHCTELSVDWNTLDGQGLFWAIVRNKVQILRLPQIGETITVKTWPMPTTRSAFPRATAGYDKNGEELFRCISLWILMDKNTRAMVLPGKSDVVVEGMLTGTELAPPSSLLPKQLSHQTLRPVCYTELDRNGHMNNTKYMDWVDDLLSSDFHKTHTPKEITLCYLNEAKEGQKIALNYQLTDGPCLEVDATRAGEKDPEKQERVFAARLLF